MNEQIENTWTQAQVAEYAEYEASMKEAQQPALDIAQFFEFAECAA